MVDGYLNNRTRYKIAILYDDLVKKPEKVISELFEKLDISVEHLSSALLAFKVSILAQICLLKTIQIFIQYKLNQGYINDFFLKPNLIFPGSFATRRF